jgi:hypothetical protein
MQIDEQMEFEKKFMLVSAIKTYLIAALFLVGSLLLNLDFVTIPTFLSDEMMEIFTILLNSLLIIMFFFFALIAMGNMQEVRGYILDWKGILLLIFISIIQGFLDGWVIFVSGMGIILVITYLYFLQGKVQNRKSD